MENPTSTEEESELEIFEKNINTRAFPWTNVVIRIFNSVNLKCRHQPKCYSNCYEKQTKSCQNMLDALLNMYRSSSSHSRSSSVHNNLKLSDARPHTTKRVKISNVLF